MSSHHTRSADSHLPTHGRTVWPLLLLALLAAGLAAGIGWSLLAGCDHPLLELPGCEPMRTVAAGAALVVGADETVVHHVDDQGTTTEVGREASDDLHGLFAKFVIAAPRSRQVLYVTAENLGMEDARLWVAEVGRPKRLLVDVGDQFWGARPVWCQTGEGDPGLIAYVRHVPLAPGGSGLQLWLVEGDGDNDRLLLDGTTANEFGPDLFYGQHQTPLSFRQNCTRLRYGGVQVATHEVDLANGAVSTVASLARALASATPTAAAAATPCWVQPFAQTDPRWQHDLMMAEKTTIRSWGCALTSTAMIFNYYGVDTDPGRLNACAADLADVLRWDPVRARCAAAQLPAPVQWQDRATWADLERALQPGHPVIVGLQGGPAGSHFVIVTGGSGNLAAGYKIADSWDGSTYKTLADYINPAHGYTLRWLVLFNGTPPPCRPDQAPRPSASVTFTSPADGGVYREPQVVHFRVEGAAVVAAEPAEGGTVTTEGPHEATVTVQQPGGEPQRHRLSFLIDRVVPQTSWTP